MTIFKKMALVASISLLALSSSNANAALIIQFEFDGEFSMFDPSGSAIAPASGVSGDMALAIDMGFWDIWNGSLLGPYDGLTSMHGSNWTADGPMTGYQNIIGDHAPAYCSSHDMCADANLDFNWNGNSIPVDATFGMDANSSVDLPSSFSLFELNDFKNSILNAWENNTLVYFDVLSIDTDGDGILGTAMTEGYFAGMTPFFEGIATISAICFGNLNHADECTYAPEPPAVPVPAAVWLFGSGLIGLVGVARRKV